MTHETYVFLERFGKPGGGKGILISDGFCPTLTGSILYVMTEVEDEFIPGVFYMECYEQHLLDGRVKGSLEVSPTLPAKSGQDGTFMLVREKAEFYENHPNDSRVNGPYEICPTLSGRMGTGGGNTPLVRDKEEEMETKGEYIVRRLMPVECERLQGFPDGYTDIPWPNADHVPDSHRYKALGNSMAVPVMRWIGERIEWALSHPITEDRSDDIPWQPELF